MEFKTPDDPRASRPDGADVPHEQPERIVVDTVYPTADGVVVEEQVFERAPHESTTAVPDGQPQQPQNAPYAQSQPQSQDAGSQATYQQPQAATGYQQPQGAYQQPQVSNPYSYQAPVKPSPFSRAWQDIKNTPEAVKTYGFKGLVNCVSILNFCFYGNAGKWAKQAADGQFAPIEKKVIDQQNFISGFFYFLIAIILSLVLGVVGVVPFLGAVIVFAASFIVPTVSLVMYQRYLAYDSFGEAFNVTDIWDKLKRNFGALWVATFVPQLIVCAISGAIMFVIMMFFGIIGGFSAASAIASGSVAGVFGLIGSLGIGGLLCFIILMFASAIGIVWSMRGCGYWVAENVPEWNSGIAQAERAQRVAAQQAAYAQQQAAAQAQYQAQQQAAVQNYQQQAQSYQPVVQPQQQNVAQLQAQHSSQPQVSAQPAQQQPVQPQVQPQPNDGQNSR